MQSLTPALIGPSRPTRFGHDKVSAVIDETLRRYPFHVAVRTAEDKGITYRELATSAYGIVERLRQFGVRAGDAVIIKLPGSVDCVTAILATQIMASVFVPVDPTESDQRTQHICDTTNAKAIVSRGRDGAVRIDGLQAGGGTEPLFRDLSYIMHTSGSTGVPKGVPIPQTALLNLADWYIDMLDFTEQSSISHLTRPAFDVSIPEIFVPLFTGGTIVIPATQMGTQIVQTIEFLARSGTTVIQLVPTVLRRFLGTLERVPHMAGQFRELRYMVCNGEPLPDAVRRRFYAIFPDAELVNSYGPTEACVAVSYDVCPRGDAELPMYIGGPAPNVSFFVLDENRSEVGFDAEGELWIGGLQTAPSYIAGDPRSAQQFVSFMTDGREQVLYKTGDQVVATREHGLRILGRKDDQVKYRGVRLEKGEIASAVGQTGLCVDTAVVIVDGAGDTGQQLVCIVTPEHADVDEIQLRLAQSLPADRVPGLVLALAELPYTRNGKQDSRALESVAKDALRVVEPGIPDDVGPIGEAPLECLLRAVRSVTRKAVTSATVVEECGIDSLSFLEVQLVMAEQGLRFSDDVYHDQEASIGEWASSMRHIEFDGSPAISSHPSPQLSGDAEKFRAEIAHIVEHIEAENPATITLHSSLLSIKNVSAPDIRDTLLEAIERLSASTTILLPTFTPSYCNTRYYHWRETKSETGVLGDLVLRELPAARTKHPVYSMAVIGPGAPELCDMDWWQYSPFADDSIFGAVSRLGGLVLGIGTSSFTHVHRCELLGRVPYMRSIDLRGSFDFGPGALDASAFVYIRDVKGQPEFQFLKHDTVRDVHELRDVMTEFPVSGTYARLIDVNDMESRLADVMETDPYGFICAEVRAEAQRAYPGEQRIKRIA